MIQSSNLANRGIVAAMGCVLLLMCCKPKTEDSKEGSQTESTKQAATEEESVPVGTSEPIRLQVQDVPRDYLGTYGSYTKSYDNFLRAITFDTRGDIWYGANHPGGLYHRKDGKWIAYGRHNTPY